MNFAPIKTSVAAGISLLAVLSVGLVEAQTQDSTSGTAPATTTTPDQNTAPATTTTPDTGTAPTTTATPDQNAPAPAATPAVGATPDQSAPAPVATPVQITPPSLNPTPAPLTSPSQMPVQNPGLTPGSIPGQNGSTGQDTMSMTMNRYGGPIFDGTPDFNLTSSFIAAGGGPYNFSIKDALANMAGNENGPGQPYSEGGMQFADNEIQDLRAQFGVEKVQAWQDTFQFAVLDAYLQAKKNGTAIPEIAPYGGRLLGERVVNAGQDDNKNFFCGYLLDKAVSHGIHSQVMYDIDSMGGELSDKDYHEITDQAMVDLAHYLGNWNVKPGSMQ